VIAATVLRDQDSAVRAWLQKHDRNQVVLKLSPLFDHGQALQGGPFVVSGVSADQLESVKLDKAGKNLKQTVPSYLERVAPLVVALGTFEVVCASDSAMLVHLDEARKLAVNAWTLSDVFLVDKVLLQSPVFHCLRQLLGLLD